MVQSKASNIRAFPNVSTTRSHLTPQEQVHSSIVRMGSTGLPSLGTSLQSVRTASILAAEQSPTTIRFCQVPFDPIISKKR